MSSRSRVLAAAAATAVCLAIAGCSSNGTASDDAAPATPSAPPATGTGPYPDPPEATEAAPLPSTPVREPHGGIPRPVDVKQTDATAVGEGALTALLTYDTAIDTSRHQATLRMVDAGWATPAYAAQQRAGAPGPGPARHG